MRAALIGWSLISAGIVVAIALAAFVRRPAVRELAGVDAIAAEMAGQVEVDPVTTTADAWESHVDDALHIAEQGRTYTVWCFRCRRPVKGDRAAVLHHLNHVHGVETPEQAALLNAYDQELTS